MSAVRYKKQLAQLEIELEARLARLKILEAENNALKQKERALQSCISGIESGLSASRTVLRSNSLRSNSITTNGSLVGSLPSPETLAGSVPKTLGPGSPNLPAVSSSSSDNDASVTTHDSASSTSPQLAQQQAQNTAVLEALEVKEQQVQQILNQIGSASSYTELYSSKLLRRATSDPTRAASFVTLDRQSRLKYLIQAIQRMALLLPKYGTAAPATSTGSAQQQLDGLIDEVSEMVLTCGLLDPPKLKLDWLMTHLETLQYEPYPEGWWQQVAQTLELTGDQKAALKLCWTRVKANKAALTAEHETLLSRLNELRQQQHNSHKQFGEIAQAVLKEQMPYSTEQLQQRQQQLRAQLADLALKQQQRQQQKLAAAAQQQQQQAEALAAQQQQQLEIWNPPSPPDEQYMELECELQEVERLLFQDLDSQGAQNPEATLQDIQDWLFDDTAATPQPSNTAQNHNCNTVQSPGILDELNPGDFLTNPRSSMTNNPVGPGVTQTTGFANPSVQDPGMFSNPQQQQQGFGGVQGYGAQGQGSACAITRAGVQLPGQQGYSNGSAYNMSSSQQGLALPGMTNPLTGQQQQQQGIVGFESAAGLGFSNTAQQQLGFKPETVVNPVQAPYVSPFTGIGSNMGSHPQTLQHQGPQGLSSPVGFDGNVMQPGSVGFTNQGSVFGSAPPAMMLQQQQQQQQWMQQQQQSHWKSAFGAAEQQQQQQQQQMPQSSSMLAPAAAAQQQAVVGFQQVPLSAVQSPAAAVAAPMDIKFKKPKSKGAKHTAATAARKGSSSSSGISSSAPAGLTQLLQSAIAEEECASLTTVKTAILEEGEMLLQISSQEQQEIERHLDVIKDRVKMQHFCQLLAFHNAFTKKQLAAFYVVSFPYLPDALSICEALDELGW